MKKSVMTLFNICLGVSAMLCPFGNASAADTHNQRNVRDALDIAALTSPELAADAALIASLPPANQAIALDSLSGEQFANVIQINQVSSQQFMRRMYDSVRYETLGLNCGQNCDEYSVWGAIGGGEASQKSSHGAKGYRLDDWNISFGAYKPIDFCFLDSWLTVGVAGSYERDDVRFKNHGRGHNDNWQGAIYTSWICQDFYSFSANIIGAAQNFIKRPVSIVTGSVQHARSRARSTQWTSYSEIGYNLCWDCLYIQPFAGIEYAWYRRHALSEHGAAEKNLHIRGRDTSATTGRFGVHLTTNLPTWGILVSGDLAYRARFSFLREHFKGSFEGHNHPRFHIHGPSQKPSGFEGALTFAKCFCDTYHGYIEIAGEQWSRYSAWNLSGGISASF
jgi:outer membrane autotransporter protein